MRVADVQVGSPTFKVGFRPTALGSKRCRIQTPLRGIRARNYRCARSAGPASIGGKYLKSRALLGLVGSGAALVLGSTERKKEDGGGSTSGGTGTGRSFSPTRMSASDSSRIPRSPPGRRGLTLSPTELEALSRLSHEAVARLTLPRSRETRKAERTMSEQIVQQPAFERQKRETNGHTSVANGHNAPDGLRCGGSFRPSAASASCSTRSHGARHGACR